MIINKVSTYAPMPLGGVKERLDSDLITRSKDYLTKMESRHTIRDFSKRKVPFSVIENCIKLAALAPSGANRQPWHFAVVSNPLVKSQIRSAAEREEQKFYSDIKKDDWLKALEPIGTHPNKPHLEVAPWLIVVFSERYGHLEDGSKQKNYYVPESVGIATGFLISALHLTGLYCLTHTPSPMGFLAKICNRPPSNKATLLLAVGHPAKNATVPRAAKIKKPVPEIISVF